MTGVNQASPPRCCGPACYRSPHVASSDRPSREAGWRTLALDLPGHGRSPGPGRGFTMDECAQAAVQVLDATDVRAPVVVFGTSWGGFVAPRVAMLAPKRLSGMVLFNTGDAADQAPGDRRARQGDGPHDRVWAARTRNSAPRPRARGRSCGTVPHPGSPSLHHDSAFLLGPAAAGAGGVR